MASTEDRDDSTEVKPFLFVDHTRLLVTSLSKYFNKPLFSDITVIGPDGRKLLCHQVVLSAGSKRFANMLEQGNLANEELPVWGVDSDALQSIIEFFYSGECTLTFPKAVAVMDAANRLDVPSLSGAANTYVREALAPQTASTILTQALQFKLGDLANSCLTIISDNFDDVSASEGFTQASFDSLKRILAHLQDTNGASHDELFKAAWKWTTSEASRASLCEEWQKIVPVPDNMNVKELVALTQGRLNFADVMLMVGGGGLSKQPQQQREGSSQADPSRGEAGTGAVSAEGAPSKGMGSQQRKSSTALDSGMGDAAAAGAAGDPMVVDTVAIKEEKGVNGAVSSAQLITTSAAPQGTLSSFDPLSGQPTPTSKALTGSMDGAMFGAGGGPADMAAAAAAAGMEMAAAQSGMDPQQYAAMFGNGAAGADGSGSGADGNQPISPSRMGGGWGHMGMMGPMGGMGGMGMPMGGMGMPGFMPMMGPMGMMGPMMGMMGGYMASGRNHAKGVCQVEGCNADLRGLRDYHLRYKICEYHLKVSSIVRDGVHQRFCQQCGRFHPLQDFDGAKRSCRARLLRHNARRRKRGEEELAAMGYSGSQSGLKRGRGSFSQMPDLEDPSASGAASGYWGMMGNMDPAYMAMMGAYNPDGSYNPAMMAQYAQYGMVSPTGSMMPNAAGEMGASGGATGGAEGGEGEKGASGGASKRAGSGSKGEKGGSEGDWEGEGGEEEGEGGQGGQDEVAWAAAGLEMLADVAQARSSAAGDRSRAGSDAGSKPGAAGATAAEAAGKAAQGAPQQAGDRDSLPQQGSPKQRLGQEGKVQDGPEGNPCSVVPLQLADSPSPHAAGGLFVGRVSPGHDAAPKESAGADDAAAAGAASTAAGKRVGGAAGAAAADAAAAAGEEEGRQRPPNAAGTSNSPSNDLAYRADKPGAAAGTVKG